MDGNRTGVFRSIKEKVEVDEGYTFIRFVLISAKFGICTVMGHNGTLVKTNLRTWDT
jgi:hypothetical protein